MRKDLKTHAAVGLLLALLVTVIVGVGVTAAAAWLPPTLHVLSNPIPAALLGFVAGERAGWVKEYVWDAGGRGTVDRDDYLWTGRGAALGAAIGLALLSVVAA